MAVILVISLYVPFKEEFRGKNKAEVLSRQDLDTH